MAKNLEITVLLDFYGEILTEKQRDYLSFYYNDDLSLSEIAENEGITRQGVRDAIKRAENQLLDIESKLKHVFRFTEINKAILEIMECAKAINECNLRSNLSREINDSAARIQSIATALFE